MQSVIAFACLLAVASAGYINNVAPVAVANGRVAYNAPLVNAPHPVPVAHAYAAPIAAPFAHGYAAPVAHAYAAPVAVAAPALPLASEARLVDPVAIAAGAPLPTGDTVEVAAAKAAHFAAHAVAKSQAYAAPVAAVAPVAHAYAAPIAHAYAAPALPLASEARLVDPVAIAAGAPLPTGDTVEVAHAKAAHFAAHAAAKGHFIAKRSPVFVGAYAAPLAYSGYASPYAYHGYGYGYGRAFFG